MRKKEGEIKQIQWKSWAKGLNTLFAPNKIRPDELSRADNVILVSQGSPTRRWGSNYYGNDGGESIHTMLAGYYKSDGSNQLVKIGNGLFKRLNTGTQNWDVVAGASFTSTQRTRRTILNDVMYISNGIDPLTKYDGTSLTRFTAISKPTNLAVARGASLTSGTFRYSYRITAINAVGETDATSNVTVQVNRNRDEWNFDPQSPSSNFSVNLTWTPSANATGYNIYGVTETTETFLDRVDGGTVTSYRDYGLKTPSTLISFPDANTTDAPKGSIITTYKSALLIAGDPNAPSRLYFSAGVDKPDDFSWGNGGGFIDINKNSDDGIITGIGLFQNSAIIFKERSIWKFDFTESEIPSLFNINRDLGALNHESIHNVENDVFFVGKKVGGTVGAFVLGNEPNFLNQIRTNELSARVRPEMLGLIASNYGDVEAFYIDNRYIFAFPDGSSQVNDRALVYDRERLGWTKWVDISLSNLVVYFDQGTQHVLFIDQNDQRVSELSSAFGNDKGDPIEWGFATREEDIADPFQFKKWKWAGLNMFDTEGLNTIRIHFGINKFVDFNLQIQNRLDSTAFASWQFGQGKFGSTTEMGGELQFGLLARRFPLHRLGNLSSSKTIKFEIFGSDLTSKLTLLDLFFEYKLRSRKYFPLEDVYQI